MSSMSFNTAALLADSINDASSTRKVYLLAGGLAVLGILLVVVTVWFWRSTRPDPELLAPLEVMGGRRFRRLEGGAQQQALDRSRPAEAKPMRWGVVRGEASSDSEIDLRETIRSAPGGFDDLRDPALIAVALESPDGEAVHVTDVEAEQPVDAPASVAAAASVDEAAEDPDPLADIDAIVAPSASAAAPAEPPASAKPTEAKPTEAKSAEALDAIAVADDKPEAAPPDLVDVDGNVPATRTVVDAPLVTQAPSTPRGSKPGAAKASVPLVIVPVDHELRVTPKRVEPADEPVAIDDTAATEQPEVDEPASIDPLLRIVNRKDG